ncbi:MAG: hypothetical protein Q9216_006546 [Gyalolechia sp. 2 TL-2023]
MDPVPPNPGLKHSLCPSSSATPRHSRKRSRSETFGDDTSLHMQRADPPNSPDSGDTDTVMSLDDTTSNVHKSVGLFSDSLNGPSGIGTSTSAELDNLGDHGKDAEDRRKFQRQEPNEDSNGDPDVAHDPMALNLGIGWKSIGDDPDRQAAARGWANFIQQNYLIDTVNIVAQDPGNDAVLAEAGGRFYVFYGDLRYGVFVAASWTECVEEFRSNPALEFEDRRFISALDSPRPFKQRRWAMYENRSGSQD